MKAYSTVASVTVSADKLAAFAAAGDADLPALFPGYGPLPAITSSKNIDGAWDSPGKRRAIFLTDGSQCSERVREFRPPDFFSYTVSDFSSSLRHLAVSADGEWEFENAGGGKTRITWRYQFIARSSITAPLVWLIGALFWKGYMQQALTLLAKGLESRA